MLTESGLNWWNPTVKSRVRIELCEELAAKWQICHENLACEIGIFDQ